MLTRKSIQTQFSRATRIGQYTRAKAEVTRLLDVIKEPLSRNLFVQPAHFYSPITTSTDFQHFGDRKRIPGIELNEDNQLALLNKLGCYYQEQPFTAQKADARRYYFDNDQFSYSDALFLY